MFFALGEVNCPQGRALQDSNDAYLVCGGASATSNCPANYYCYYDTTSYGCCATQGRYIRVEARIRVYS